MMNTPEAKVTEPLSNWTKIIAWCISRPSYRVLRKAADYDRRLNIMEELIEQKSTINTYKLIGLLMSGLDYYVLLSCLGRHPRLDNDTLLSRAIVDRFGAFVLRSVPKMGPLGAGTIYPREEQYEFLAWLEILPKCSVRSDHIVRRLLAHRKSFIRDFVAHNLVCSHYHDYVVRFGMVDTVMEVLLAVVTPTCEYQNSVDLLESFINSMKARNLNLSKAIRERILSLPEDYKYTAKCSQFNNADSVSDQRMIEWTENRRTDFSRLKSVARSFD